MPGFELLNRVYYFNSIRKSHKYNKNKILSKHKKNKILNFLKKRYILQNFCSSTYQVSELPIFWYQELRAGIGSKGIVGCPYSNPVCFTMAALLSTASETHGSSY